MRGIAWALVLLLSTGPFASYVAHAQVRSCTKYQGIGRSICEWNHAFNSGDFARAKMVAEQLKRRLDRGQRHNPEQYARVLMAIGKPALSLGQTEQARAAFAEALSLVRRHRMGSSALAIELNGRLGEAYNRLGNCALATQHLNRTIELWQTKRHKNLLELAAAHNSLSNIHKGLGRFDLAEQGLKRAIADARRAASRSPTANRHVAVYEANLARLYQQRRRYGDMKEAAQRAYAAQRKVLKSNDPDYAQTLVALAGAYRELPGQAAEGLPHLRRALRLAKAHYGPSHGTVASVLVAYANTNLVLGRLAQAERQLLQALKIRERLLPDGHRLIGSALDYLARLKLKQDQGDAAVRYSRRAAAIASSRLSRDVNFVCSEDVSALRGFFNRHLTALDRAAEQDSRRTDLADESFRTAQWASGSTAAVAVARMAARYRVAGGRNALMIRRQQDAWIKRRDLEKQLFRERSKEPGARDRAYERDLRREIDRLDRKLQQVDHLVVANPLAVREVQALLGPEEALIVFHVAEDQSYLFALTRDEVRRRKIAIGGLELLKRVGAFRVGLGFDVRNDGTARAAQADSGGFGGEHPFNIGRAHALYRDLIGPVEDMIEDKRQLLLVPSGALTSLPFHLLVTTAPDTPTPVIRQVQDFAKYRAAAWLIKRHAITVIPAVANLKALRLVAGTSRGRRPMVGFGDPVFKRGSAVNPRRSKRGSGRRTERSYRRRSPVDLQVLENGLSPLPETGDELRSVAQMLGAHRSDLFLGRVASEGFVKQHNLMNYRVVYFATHGLVAGQVAKLDEPALVFSLPAQPTAVDDGLLKASEVAQLKLDADWVVLSACNTAAPADAGEAGDQPEALSGLARAFFYAGARSLLVTHWEAYSDAASWLAIRTFEILRTNARIGRSEALRQAMLEYMADPKDPTNAYPEVWGPFQLVGAGRAG